MAASTVQLDFDKWLSVKLKALNTDESIFGDYIKGILEGEESQDEKIDALEGILVEISSVKWFLSFHHTVLHQLSYDLYNKLSNA